MKLAQGCSRLCRPHPAHHKLRQDSSSSGADDGQLSTRTTRSLLTLKVMMMMMSYNYRVRQTRPSHYVTQMHTRDASRASCER